MKKENNSELFNKIIEPDTKEENTKEKTGDVGCPQGTDDAETDNQTGACATADKEEPEAAVKSSEQGDSTEKKQMPPVKPSTIILMCLFAVLFTLGYFFAPYVIQYLPFGGQTISQDIGIDEVGYDYLIKDAYCVVVGKTEAQRTVYSDDIYVSERPLVYTEHMFKIEDVLFGNPDMENENHIVTYTLGGTVILQDNMGRPERYNYKYNDAADLGNSTVLLFLDDQNNIINEKYGVFKQHAEGYFYDYRGTVYSLEDIKAALVSRK